MSIAENVIYDQKTPKRGRFMIGLTIGDKGIRTPGLLIANQSLYQLSYIPQWHISITNLKKIQVG